MSENFPKSDEKLYTTKKLKKLKQNKQTDIYKKTHDDKNAETREKS